MKKIKYFGVLTILALLNFLMFENLKKEQNFISVVFMLIMFWSLIMVFFAFIKEVFNEKNN